MMTFIDKYFRGITKRWREQENDVIASKMNHEQNAKGWLCERWEDWMWAELHTRDDPAEWKERNRAAQVTEPPVSTQ